MIGFLKKYQISIALGTLFFWTSCQTAPMCEYGDVLLNAGFYTVKSTGVEATTIDSVSVYLLSGNNELFIRNKSIKNISLPLSLNSDSTIFVFMFDSIITDTIIVKHTFDLKLVTHECGFVGFYNITNIRTTNNRIDSVRVRKEIVDYATEENIRIHF